MTWRPVEGGEPQPNTSPGAGPFHHTPQEWHFLPLKPQVPKQQPDGGGGGGGEKWRKLQGHSSTLAARLSRTSRSPFSACCPEHARQGSRFLLLRRTDGGRPATISGLRSSKGCEAGNLGGALRDAGRSLSPVGLFRRKTAKGFPPPLFPKSGESGLHRPEPRTAGRGAMIYTLESGGQQAPPPFSPFLSLSRLFFFFFLVAGGWLGARGEGLSVAPAPDLSWTERESQ